ncbi:MAG: tetratricopeptide repeat protein, partial [Planctomycetota bacterium]
HRLRRRVDEVVGSGSAARTYLTVENGRRFELPLTWYTQAEKWDFSPGYREANIRFSRLVPDRCMACHNGIPEAVEHVDGLYASVPDGITCERCHGPGELHVEERLVSPEADGEIDVTIVNPADLPYERRLDVCQQCHLSAPGMVLREGRGAFDFMPSEPLSSHLAVFVRPGGSGANVDVVSHANRMRESECFLGTLDANEPLECTTCHNPHEGFRNAGPAYFNETCQSCHLPAELAEQVPAEARSDHQAGAPCFSCHMPKVEAADAPHSSFTDHKIRVVQAGEAKTPPPFDREHPLVPYFERDYRNRTGQAYLGMALVVMGRQSNDQFTLAQGAATLDVALAEDSTLSAGFFLLGVARQALGELTQAIPAFERALRAEPGNPERLHALATVYEQAGRDARRVEALYRRALQLQPRAALFRIDYARFLHRQGRLDAARGELVEALAERPSLDAGVLRLGLLELDAGRDADARLAFQEALRLEPGHARTLRNLIDARDELTVGSPVQTPLLSTLPSSAAGWTVQQGALRVVGTPAAAQLSVYSDAGLLLRRLDGLAWDLRAANGQRVPTGEYLLHVRSSAGVDVIRFAVAGG